MKNIFLYLIIAAWVLSCQPEQKKKAENNQTSLRLAHEPGEEKEPKVENTSFENTCSDDYEHQTFTIGKGLVLVNSGNGEIPYTIELFNDSLLQDKYVSWNYYEDKKPQKLVCPKYFTLEPDVVQFVYLKETAKAYQVVNGFDEIKYLPKSKANVAESWEDHIIGSYGIRRLTTTQGKIATDQQIKKHPSPNSENIKFQEGYEMFCPMEINGDWVKVQYDCFYNQETNKYEGLPCHEFIEKCKPAQFGWIKWREKNKILIDILLMP